MPGRHGAIVVGTSFGGRVHVPALRAAGIDVLALVGRDAGRTRARAAQLGVDGAYTDLSEALQATDASCVTVATPPDVRSGPVLEALAAGRHVLCEKPFAADLAEARTMVDAAERAGVVALIGCEFRWVPEEAVAGRALADGLIGEPRLVTFVQHSALVADGLHGAFNDEWWFDRSRGGGILNAAGIHVIDRLRTWLGEIAGVSASLVVAGHRPASGAEDSYSVLVRFRSGCTGVLQHCAATHGEPVRLCRVVGDRGTVTLTGQTAEFSAAGSSAPLPVPPDLELPAPPPRSPDPKHAFTTLELPAYTRLAQRFLLLMEGGRPPAGAPPTPTFADGLRNQEVLDAIRTSAAAAGAWVDIPG